jgi:deazaflavin-dependent oxidoreductase (nitroreductase family)
MGSDQLRAALQGGREVELTVTGRKSGKESTRPIWFVEEGKRLLLLPINGTDTGWYRNIEKTPSIRLAAAGADYEVTAEPTTDPAKVEHVIEAFGEKYGADQVRDLYPNKNAAVEVPLG